MFGLGIWEIALILVVALLVLGPEKLPDAAKSLGKALNDFKRAGEDIRREVMGENLPPPKAPAPPVPPQTIAAKADPRATPVGAEPPAPIEGAQTPAPPAEPKV